jgi:citrate lyase beta subunit
MIALQKKIIHGSDYKLIPWLYMSASQDVHLDLGIGLLQKDHRANLVIDLEDSLTFLGDEEKTLSLKAQGRQYILERAKLYENFLGRVYIRVNAIDTPYFPEDEKFLKALHGRVEGVVLPKSENVSDIKTIHQLSFKVMPLIETPRGLKNLSALVRHADHYFRFGPQDYFKRDDKNLRFPLPLSPIQDYDFDQIIKKLIAAAKKYHKTFVTPVFGRLKDSYRYAETNKYIIQQFNKGDEIGITALNPNQYGIATGIKELIWKPVYHQYRSITKDRTFALAMLVSAEFQGILDNESFKNCVKSLAHDDKGFYVTPHQYELAQKYLSSLIAKFPEEYSVQLDRFALQYPDIYRDLKNKIK